MLFIDPVVDVFVDPCNPEYTEPTIREKEKFYDWTKRFQNFFDAMPTFDCTELCQAPSKFYSGIPWLAKPSDGGTLTLVDSSKVVIEWQLWTDALTSENYTVMMNGEELGSTGSEVGYFQGIRYKIQERGTNKVRTIRLMLQATDDTDAQ